jgi:hypothetical protein
MAPSTNPKYSVSCLLCFLDFLLGIPSSSIGSTCVRVVVTVELTPPSNPCRLVDLGHFLLLLDLFKVLQSVLLDKAFGEANFFSITFVSLKSDSGTERKCPIVVVDIGVIVELAMLEEQRH